MFDIEVQLCKKEVVVCARTDSGYDALRDVMPWVVSKDQQYVMIKYPDEFMDFISPNVKVGVRSDRTKKFIRMSKNCLH